MQVQMMLEIENDAKQEEANCGPSLGRCSDVAGEVKEEVRTDIDRSIRVVDSYTGCEGRYTPTAAKPGRTSRIKDPDALVSIYTLSDPRDGSIRYVGRTIDARLRLIGHKYNAQGMSWMSPRKCEWLNGIYAAGLEPILDVVRVVTQAEAWEAERQQIFKCVADGCSLTNRLPMPLIVFSSYTKYKLEYPGSPKSLIRIGLRIPGPGGGSWSYRWEGTDEEKAGIIRKMIEDAKEFDLEDAEEYITKKVNECLSERKRCGQL